MLPVVSRKQIFYKHGHGHGTAAAGHGRDSSGNLFDCLKIHVAAQFSVNEICTYVKHNRSVGHHVGSHKPRSARTGYDYIRFEALLF